MLYVQVDVTLINHPKLKRLARCLDVSQVTACGHLVALWSWAAQYAPDGDLTDYLTDSGSIADGAAWEGDPERFMDALVNGTRIGSSAGFLEITIDGALVLHDWEEYFGKVLDKRQTDAERKRKEREAAKQAREAEEHEAAKQAGRSAPRPAERPQPDAGRPADVHVTSDGHPTDAARMSALNVAQRNVNAAQRNETERNDNGDAPARAEPAPDPAAAAVVFDLAPQQLAALSLLLTAVPQFGDPVNFVRRNNPKLIAYWSLYINDQPPERLATIDNVGGLIAAYVKAGNFPQLKPDIRRQYDESVDRFLNHPDDPDIAEFLSHLTDLTE